MAAGWPTKVTYANGDVYSASDVNDTNGTLNYIDPTSATNNQVLTRDSAAPGKVKWANSPANTLTTTGDLYYASAANTPARLPIGSSAQVLTVSGGVPTWSSGGGSYTTLASGSLSGALSLSSISGAYQTLLLRITNPGRATNNFIQLQINGLVTGYAGFYVAGVTNTAGPTTSFAGGYAQTGTPNVTNEFYFYNYANTSAAKGMYCFSSNSTNPWAVQGQSGTAAITSILSVTAFTGGTYELIGIK